MAELVNILVAEGVADRRRDVSASLAGYRVFEATSGREALRILLEQEIDVLVADVRLPDMTGIEVAELVHQRERTQTLPILLLSPQPPDRELLDRSFNAGALDVLTWPVAAETLRARVAPFAQLQRQREQLAEQATRIDEQSVAQLQVASERRYRNLAEAVPNIVWTTLADGTVDYFNRRWFEYTGITTERAAGSWRSALHPDDIEPFMAAWQRSLKNGERHELECRLRRADGQYRWHLCRAVPERGPSGEIEAWLGSFTDIDDERRSREVLAEFKGTLDAVLDAVMIFDPETLQLMYVNLGASALLGLTPGQLGVMRATDITAEHDEAGLRALLAVLASGEQKTYMVETRFRRRDGRTVPVEVSFQLIRVNGGRVVSIARDITERLRTRAERDLLYRETVDALRARDEFLSIASHELRTPLSALQLQIEMLMHPPRRDPSAVQSPEDIKKKLDVAARQVDRLTRLISELLDVSRITAGRIQLEREAVDLASVARDVVERFASEATKARCTVTLYAPGPVKGTWDHMRMEQVVTNLLTNAFKFGAGKPIEIAVIEAADKARLTVTDHGVGIPPEDIDRIFRRFEQAATSQRTYGGLGLGLYIVRGLVEAHGGHVRVDSTPGQGATFTVEVPREVPHRPTHPDSGDLQRS
jgi:PAS domain S-box-containing protein